MVKCRGQRNQPDGDPHLGCIDVRRELLWMHESPTWPFFSTPLMPFSFSWFFFLLLLIAQGMRACFIWCISVIYPLDDGIVHRPWGVGTCKGSFSYDDRETWPKNWVMAIMSEVELMLSFCPRANLNVLAIFCILIFLLFCLWPSYALSVSFRCINLLRQISRPWLGMRMCWCQIPMN